MTTTNKNICIRIILKTLTRNCGRKNMHWVIITDYLLNVYKNEKRCSCCRQNNVFIDAECERRKKRALLRLLRWKSAGPNVSSSWMWNAILLRQCCADRFSYCFFFCSVCVQCSCASLISRNVMRLWVLRWTANTKLRWKAIYFNCKLGINSFELSETFFSCHLRCTILS